MLLKELDHARKRGDQVARQFAVGSVPDEEEERDTGAHGCVPFLRSVADVAVVAKGDPATSPDLGQPLGVRGQWTEVIIMPLYGEPGIAKGIGHAAPKVTVREEGGSVHQDR